MKLEDFNQLEQWMLNGYVALYLCNVDRLAAVCAAITISAIFYPALLLKNEVAGLLESFGGDVLGVLVGILFLLASFHLVSRFIGFWIINPLGGLYVLAKARYSYGPATRRKILEWVIEQGGGEAKAPLDIAALARAHGELK